MKHLYEEIANKAANIIGFNQTDIESFDRSKASLFANSYSGAEPLCNYLNYRYFDSKTENFLLTDSAAGFLLSPTGIEKSPRLSGEGKI